jgi:hypothetical protein
MAIFNFSFRRQPASELLSAKTELLSEITLNPLYITHIYGLF